MDFRLTEEQSMFAEAVRGFSETHLRKDALERAHRPSFPKDIAELMAAQGLLGIAFDVDDGGQGGTLMDSVLAIEQVAAVCPRSADVVQAYNFGPIRTLVEYASADQKRRWLPDLLAGRTVVSLCMTEPDAGSAATELKTTAHKDGSSVVINGTKIFSTHSAEADLFLVYVRFGPGTGGIGSVVVEKDAPGFRRGRPTSFMSGEQWCQLYFEDCRIPQENILLGPGGFKKQMAGFNVERIGNSARSLALGRYAFEIAREHSTIRRQFGRPLCEFQGLQWKFADMAVKLEAAQLMLYRAASQEAGQLPSSYDTVVAKILANQAGFEVANEALQIMGGTGYSQDSLVEYCVRRTRGWMIAGGSTEMLKNRIAEKVFERRFSQRPKAAA